MLSKIKTIISKNFGFLPFTLATIYLIIALTTLSLIDLDILALKAKMTTLALKFLLLIAGAFSIFVIYKICILLKTPRKAMKTIKQEFQKDPIKENPIKSAASIIVVFFNWLDSLAKERPITMMIFGIFYTFPLVVLILHFYYGTQFTGFIGWMLNNIFLPTANGLVNPAHSHWLAATATGFLFAKIFFLIADLLTKKKESLLVKCLYAFFKKPIKYILGITATILVTKILSGIEFFTHLSGYWLIFNLAFILLKIVGVIYDIFEQKEKGIIYKSIMFPFRFLREITSKPQKLLADTWKEIKLGLFEVIISPFSRIAWPILRTYLYPVLNKSKFFTSSVFATRSNEDIKVIGKMLDIDSPSIEKIREVYIDKNNDSAKLLTVNIKKLLTSKFERSAGDAKTACIHILNKISFPGAFSFAAGIYTSIPLISLIFYQHLALGPAFNWYNQIILALHAKTSVSILCLTALMAIMSISILSILTCKRNLRITCVLALTSIVFTMSLITNSISFEMSKNITYCVITAIALCLLNFIYQQGYWVLHEHSEYKKSKEIQSKKTITNEPYDKLSGTEPLSQTKGAKK